MSRERISLSRTSRRHRKLSSARSTLESKTPRKRRALLRGNDSAHGPNRRSIWPSRLRTLVCTRNPCQCLVNAAFTGEVKYWHWTVVRVTRLIKSEVPGLDLSGWLYKRRSQEKTLLRRLEVFLLRSPHN